MQLTRGLRFDRAHPWRHENTGRLLLMALSNWEAAFIRNLRKRGFRDFRVNHLNILRHIDAEGTKISEIAERAALSKPAVGHLLANCEADGLVSIMPHPTDGRAKIVTFTPKSMAIIEAEHEVLEHIDRVLAEYVGPGHFADLRRSLAKISEWSGK